MVAHDVALLAVPSRLVGVVARGDPMEVTEQTKTVNYARSQGYMAKRNYQGPGCEVGWPDVEIFLPGGVVLLFEFKSLGKKLRKIQSFRINRLLLLGFVVETVYTFEEAKGIIDARATT